jgi:hypothetical protein
MLEVLAIKGTYVIQHSRQRGLRRSYICGSWLMPEGVRLPRESRLRGLGGGWVCVCRCCAARVVCSHGWPLVNVFALFYESMVCPWHALKKVS